VDAHLSPQLLKPCGIGSGVANGVLNVAVPETAAIYCHAGLGQDEMAPRRNPVPKRLRHGVG
jgi:hypothetical protein